MNDLTLATNHWVIEDPKWVNYSKFICTAEHHWLGYYGDNFFLQYIKPGRCKPEGRFFITYPNIAEHFYTIDWFTNRYDTIFASYDLNEIKRFLSKLELDKWYGVIVRDLVNGQHWEVINGIIQMEEK